MKTNKSKSFNPTKTEEIYSMVTDREKSIGVWNEHITRIHALTRVHFQSIARPHLQRCSKEKQHNCHTMLWIENSALLLLMDKILEGQNKFINS